MVRIANLVAMESSTAGTAQFERVAGAIRADIRAGVLKPGEQLPSQRDVAAKYGVAVATAQRALQLLQDERWVTKRPSVGVFVSGPTEGPRPVTLDVVSHQVAELQAVVADLADRVQKIEHQNAP